MKLTHVLWILLFSVIISLHICISTFIISHEWFAFKDFFKAVAIDLCLFLTLLLLPRVASALLIALLSIPYTVLSFVGTFHVFNFRSGLSEYAIHSIFETSSNEASETFATFFTSSNILLLIVVVLICTLVTYKAIRSTLRYKRSKVTTIALALVLTVTIAQVYRSGYSVTHANLPYSVIAVYLKYENELKDVAGAIDKRKEYRFDNVTIDGDSAAKRTYVIIVGESISKNHQAIYGYFRPTTPKLESIKDDIYLFTDVISTHTLTIPSMRETLWFNDIDEGKTFYEARTLLNLYNSAGFKTFWLSNQTNDAYGLTGTAVIQGDASESNFFNHAKDESRTVLYDDILITGLKDALVDDANNKVIFLHMVGAHHSYRLRYPSSFARFKTTNDIPNTPYRNNSNKKYINEYDNAVLFNDYIIFELINIMKQESGENILVYFSDHGQEVYDEIGMRGQNAKVPTRHMYEIPFIVWLSDEYKKNNKELVNKIENNLDTPFSLYNFPYTVSEMSLLKFPDNIPSLSVFSDNFIVTDRKIAEGLIYEDLVRNK